MSQLSTIEDARDITEIDTHALLSQAEQALLDQFGELTRVFNSRNGLLIDKAKRAVTSHTKRTLDWLERQLARNDLDIRIRNMHTGRRRNLNNETQSKLDEIERKSQIRSSLEVIGAVVIYPVESA